MKTLTALFGLLALASFAEAQSLPPYQPAPAPYPAPNYPAPNYPAPPVYQQTPPPANQVTPQVLGEMLRSAATFNELVRNMNLNRSLGPDLHAVGPDGRMRHSVERTAETIGAGAGAGAALGAMSRNPNGVMIGALIGGAGGFIVDQVLRHQEEVREHAAGYASRPEDRPREFRQREDERR